MVISSANKQLSLLWPHTWTDY